MFRYAYCGFAPRYAFAFHGARHQQDRSDPFMESRHGRSGHGGPMLGVRRPIRYLAYRLDLDDRQVREVAEILDRLKIARAQAEVDDRRATSELAGAVESGEFDSERAGSAFAERARAGEEVRRESLAALQRLHALLDPEQRRELSYLLRSGHLSI